MFTYDVGVPGLLYEEVAPAQGPADVSWHALRQLIPHRVVGHPVQPVATIISAGIPHNIIDGMPCPSACSPLLLLCDYSSSMKG